MASEPVPGQRPMLPVEVLAVRTGKTGEASGGEPRPPLTATADTLAVEAPLQIRAAGSSAITMRTPGADPELAVGFLFAEGIVRNRDEVLDVAIADDGAVEVQLSAEAIERSAALDRRFTVTSACGACGKPTAEAALRLDPPFAPPPADRPRLTPALVTALPDRLRAAQPTFAHTGGLHAAGLFDAGGTALLVREDVGRHNAVDKVVGARLLAGGLPARDCVLVVSGRASFELVQKAVLAGIPVLAAVGAPSTLAVEVAAAHGLTLLGFVRDGRFNIYTHPARIDLPAGRV
jgi:FdhD protein